MRSAFGGLSANLNIMTFWRKNIVWCFGNTVTKYFSYLSTVSPTVDRNTHRCRACMLSHATADWLFHEVFWYLTNASNLTDRLINLYSYKWVLIYNLNVFANKSKSPLLLQLPGRPAIGGLHFYRCTCVSLAEVFIISRIIFVLYFMFILLFLTYHHADEIPLW